jgi:hypothetical protein
LITLNTIPIKPSGIFGRFPIFLKVIWKNEQAEEALRIRMIMLY